MGLVVGVQGHGICSHHPHCCVTVRQGVQPQPTWPWLDTHRWQTNSGDQGMLQLLQPVPPKAPNIAQKPTKGHGVGAEV